MVVKSFEVEHVLSELILMILTLIFFLDNRVVALLLEVLVLVAIIVTSSLLAVLLPGSKAHPAEVVVADSASHVVAALVLLNRLLAFWTVLCIGHDPGDVF